MKIQLFMFLMVMSTSGVFAQFTNGGIVHVENDAVLFIEGDIQNKPSSTMNINGTVALKGNFTNQGAVVSDVDGTVQFMGTTESTMTAGTGNYAIISMDKAGASLGTADVRLLGNLSVDKTLDFTNGSNTRMVIGNHDLSIASAATVDAAAATKYVVTNGTGVMEQKLAATTVGYPAAITHPVGDINNYSPITSDLTGTTLGTTDPKLSIRVAAVQDANLLVQSTDYIRRHWNVSASNVTTYSNTMTGTYTATPDLEGSAVALVGSFDDATGEWYFNDGASTATTVTAKTTLMDTDFTGQNFYGKVSAMAMLDGPYDDATGLMNNTLKTKNLIPTTSPYDASVSVTAQFLIDNPTIVDWVEIEAKTTGATPTSKKSSGFVLTDGNIMTVDGTSGLAYIKDAEPNAYVIINHRNHLAVSTPATIDLRIKPTVNFTDKTYSTFGTHAQRLRTNKAAMWAGDANGDGAIKYQGADNDNAVVGQSVRNHFSNFFNSWTYSYESYEGSDLNMDGVIKYQGANNDATSVLLNSVISHPANFFNARTFTISTNIPQ